MAVYNVMSPQTVSSTGCLSMFQLTQRFVITACKNVLFLLIERF